MRLLGDVLVIFGSGLALAFVTGWSLPAATAVCAAVLATSVAARLLVLFPRVTR